MTKSKSSHYTKSRKGFSLVEMLAVIGIIGIMAVIIGVSFTGTNETVALGNAQRIGASVFQSARSIAVLRQQPTRVIIYADHGEDSKKFLRYMGIVYLSENATDPENPAPGDWIPANQGTYLPEGIYYIPEGGATDTTGLIADNLEGGVDLLTSNPKYDKSSATDIMEASFPIVGGTNNDFYFYEFDANGMSENPGGNFVINAGSITLDGNGDEAVEITNPFAVAGFAIRRIGGITLFSDYDEIQALQPEESG